MSQTDEERLVIMLEARIKDLERNMAKASGTTEREFRKMSMSSKRATAQMEQDAVRSSARINQAMATVSTKMGAVGKAFAGGLVAGAAIGAIEGIRQAAIGSTKAILEMSDQAKMAGVSFKAFQQLKFVAEQNRIGIDALTDGLKELNLRADEFIVTGKGSAAEAFTRLGYSAENLREKLKQPDQLFLEIIGKLERLDRAAQIRIADELFGGTGGEKFVQLISQGEQGLRRQIKAAEDLGIVMDETMVKKAEEVNQKFSAITTSIGVHLKAAIVDAVSAWFEFLDSYNEFKDQKTGTLQRRQAELGSQRLDLENKILETQNDGNLTQEKKNKASGSYRIELEKIAKEEAEIVKLIGQRGTTQLEPITISGSGYNGGATPTGTSPYKTAKAFKGATENRDGDLLSSFFKQANQNVDPKMTAWCAAFVNAALAANGMPGTGSLAAKSFLDYGTATNDPRQGDIVVLKRGGGNGGHVGFFEGYDENGNVRVFGGNQSDGVNTKSFKRDDVLGYRSIPGAERSSLSDTLTDELGRRMESAQTLKEKAEAYDQVVERARAYIASQNVETQAIGMTEQAASRLRYEQELLNEAKQAGLTLDPAQLGNLKALASEMAAAEERTRSLAKSQQDLQAAAEEFGSQAKSVVGGFISDLTRGADASDALRNALARIGDIALDGLLSQLFGGGNVKGGGLFGSLFTGLFGGIGKNADGTEFWRGGPTWVGERGPEIINAPRGSSIVPNHHLPRADNGNEKKDNSRRELVVNVQGASGDNHVRELARQGAQEAIQQEKIDQARGGFGSMNQKYNSRKG
ncbi:hypothetical protein A6U97_02490 [Agrobacterium tumefaciens]|uniref:TIGR02594 family protein n=1 Tax=Agrobacterium tumefaciens TaxID=358 RepID=UPI00081000BE|nr:hypothetical protein A6U97_02490 [Agrobacterium tumefaciens]